MAFALVTTLVVIGCLGAAALAIKIPAIERLL